METTDPLREAANSLLIQNEPATPEPEAEQVETAEPEGEAGEEAPAPDVPTEGEADAEEAPEQDDADADAADHVEPDRYTVKVNGEEVEVSLDDLKRAYSGDAHIQKGMREAADAKKQAQAVFEALQAEQKRFMDFAQRVQSDGFLLPPKAPDPKLAQTDPIGWIEAQAAFQTASEAYHQQQAEIQRYTQAQQAATSEQTAAHFAEQKAALERAIPAFSDPVRGKELLEALRKTGQTYGFSDMELGGISDARAVQVLHDAHQWRQLQAKKAEVKVNPPKNVKPAAKRPEPAQLARARLIEKAKKSDDLKDWAATLLE